MSYMTHASHRNIILSLSVFIIFFYFLTSSQLESRSTPLSYFNYTSPKQEFLQELEHNPTYQKTGINIQPSHPAELPLQTKVLRQLKTLFPYDPTLPIPKKLWQMWKVGLEHDEFPKKFKQYRSTWVDGIPDYEHIVKTNEECDAMVQELYADIPDILHAYNIMPRTILKCDFSRYLILFAYGGVYADIDTELLKPIDSWISSKPQYLDKDMNLGLVVGVESDRDDWVRKYSRRLQINTWTIMARKGHPMLAELINEITQITLRREETGLLNATLGIDAGDNVMNWTGPGEFTDVLFRYMNSILQEDFDNYETLINYSFFININHPVAVGDVMVLPKECMSPTRRSKATGEFSDPMAYVHHKGSGVWKKEEQKIQDEAKAKAN
ncbi:Initiation-specific alpha-16-mannosyltransferase [Spathaspora sp. JA1]|nr:Initiation-specific alpha-16-mannosyltransferase [Spathaspora sp. JA1]